MSKNLTSAIRLQIDQIEVLKKEVQKLREDLETMTKWNHEQERVQEEMLKPFCDECPIVGVDHGYFNPFTGEVRPPDTWCPVDWQFGTEGCFALKAFQEACKTEEQKALEENEKMAKELEQELDEYQFGTSEP